MTAPASGRGRLYLRIWLAVLASLTLFALLAGVAWKLIGEHSYGPNRALFAALAEAVLPASEDAQARQQQLLDQWKGKLHGDDLALFASDGRLIASTARNLPSPEAAPESGFALSEQGPVTFIPLSDGRWLIARQTTAPPVIPIGLVGILLAIAAAVGMGTYPVVRRLTRRLERLQSSVERLGGGDLSTRVAVEGRDEVAQLATSFNSAAARIEALVAAHKSLLANASHELRSPLARIRVALAMLEERPTVALNQELARDIDELDQLIDEILLASRLDTAGAAEARLVFGEVELTGLAAEEAARVGATIEGPEINLHGDARLLRRLLRNLLENARRYGGGVSELLLRKKLNEIEIDVCDRGAGVPEPERERIFEPFYRAKGAAERAGGVGLGLSLVRQIAVRHGGSVRCFARDGGGSCFRVTLPGLATAGVSRPLRPT